MNNITPTDQFDQKVLELVNQERTKRGFEALKLSEKLDKAADKYSEDMLKANHFSHTGPDGSSFSERIEDAGYTNWRSLAENIAAGQQTPEEVVQGWMDSPGHRANILRDSVTHMGLGYAKGEGDRYGTRWTQVFGAGDPNPGEYVAQMIEGSPSPAPTPKPDPKPDPLPDPTPNPMPTPDPTGGTPPSPTPDPTPAPAPDPMPTPAPPSGGNEIVDSDRFDQEVLRLVNQARNQQKLKPLSMSEKLDTAADDYSQKMIEENRFSHRGSDGSSPGDRIEKADYTQWNTWAENIAAGQQSAKDVVEAWMRSPGHRANILNSRVTHMGLGYAEGDARYGNRWTQVFAAGDTPGRYTPETKGNPTPTPDPDPIPDPGNNNSPLDLSGFRSYGGRRQDRNSRSQLSQNKTALKITGNGWKRLGIDYSITPDTMLKLEFRSATEGEIQGIGFDTDNRIRKVDQDRMFQFSGTQKWGNRAFDDYVTGEGWKTYEIPVGEFFTGEMDFLTFANDHDVRRPNAISEFRNIELFEQADGIGDSQTPSADPLQTNANPLTQGDLFPTAPQGM